MIIKKENMYDVGNLCMFLGIILLINYISASVFFRIDCTKNQIYSLSKPSKRIVREIKQPIHVKVYFTKNLPTQYNTNRKYLSDLLLEYKSYSKNIKLSFIDPDESQENMREAESYGIMPLNIAQITKDKREIKKAYMGVVFLFGDKREILPYITSIDSLEYDITSAIKKLTLEQKKVVGYMQGHGEYDISLDQNILTNMFSHYDVKFISLNEDKILLDELDCLLIIGPTKKFKLKDKIKIDQFLMKNKPVAFLVDTLSVDIPTSKVQILDLNLNDMLSFYGLSVSTSLVADLKYSQLVLVNQRQAGFNIQLPINYPLFPIITDIDKTNPVVKGLKSLTFPLTSYVHVNEEIKQNVKVLARTSKYSVEITEPFSISPLDKVQVSTTTKRGPFVVACYIEGKIKSFAASVKNKKDLIKESESARLMVIANSRFMQGQFRGQGQGQALFLNIIDWLAQDEDLITIRSKGFSYRPLRKVSNTVRLIIKYINIFFVPILFIIFGVFKWRYRKMKMGSLI